MKRKVDKTDKFNSSCCIFETKLTRSKAKKILQSQPKMIWPVTPVRKLSESEINFINEELPEESDDEEYKPSIDDLQDQSEEESGIKKFKFSFICMFYMLLVFVLIFHNKTTKVQLIVFRNALFSALFSL